jgi:hypothetical protein
MHHYRHYSIFVTATRGDRVSNTVEFFPTKYNMPATSSNDRLAAAIEEITHIVEHKPRPAKPFLHNGEPTNAMLAQLCEIFATATPQQTPQLLTTNRDVPRVHDNVTENVTAPRVAATPTGTGAATPKVSSTPATAPATPRVQTPSHHAPAPRVQTTPMTIIPSPRRARTPRKAPKALTRSHLREGSYWQPSQPRRIGRTQTTTAGYACAIDQIVKREYVNNTERIHQHQLDHYAYAVTDEATGEQLEYRQLLRHPQYRQIWLISAANEFGRLAQGIAGRVARTDTMFFIHKQQVPSGRKVTYPRVVCTI